MKEITPLTKESPRPRRSGGGRGSSSSRTIQRRQQMQAEPGEWFVWKRNSKSGSEATQVLSTLTGFKSLTGIDRDTLQYQVVARLNDNDGLWTIYARYVDNTPARLLPQEQ